MVRLFNNGVLLCFSIDDQWVTLAAFCCRNTVDRTSQKGELYPTNVRNACNCIDADEAQNGEYVKTAEKRRKGA